MSYLATFLTKNRALQRNQILTDLLRDSPIHHDKVKRKRVDKALKDVETDSPPGMPTTSANSAGKRTRRDSSSVEDDEISMVSEEALVVASAGCYEDLDFLEEGLLHNREISGTGYVGRESPVHWLQSLQERLSKSETGRSRVPAGSGEVTGEDSEEPPNAFAERRKTISRSENFTKSYYYLDSIDIDVEVGDPHVVPSVETAQRLFGYYREVVHNPFRILGDAFVSQLRTFYFVIQSGGMLPVCAKWKACLNLVFAIGARYSHLIGDEWQADDHE